MTTPKDNTAVPVPGHAAGSLIQANRKQFETLWPELGAARIQVRELEAQLAAVDITRDLLARRIKAFETSTLWQLTKPLRLLVDALRPRKKPKLIPESDVAEFIPVVRQTGTSSYDQWITEAEDSIAAEQIRLLSINTHIDPHRVGLVFMAQDHADIPAALTCPQTMAVLVLHSPEKPIARDQLPSHAIVRSVPATLPPPGIVELALTILDVPLVCFHDAADALPSYAPAAVLAMIARDPDLDVIFGDEDWLNTAGTRVEPFFKPGGNAEIQRELDLVGPTAFYRTNLVRKATIGTDPAWRYDVANQVIAATRADRIGHIPIVLCHRRKARPQHEIRNAAAAQFRRDNVSARVDEIAGVTAWHRVAYDVPDPAPRVSVIIPTRDRPDLLSVSTAAVLQETRYPNLELLIIDNGSVDPTAFSLLDTLSKDSRVTVIRDASPFNWAVLNNRAAALASGEILLFLNNDIAVLQPDWLEILVGHALQPGIGAVGAKLLYPDGRIQHAGVTAEKNGHPRHVFGFSPGDYQGLSGVLGCARDVWGVTGACMAVPREVFFAVGGLNEALPISFNDVDFCLRLTVNGYQIVWTPWSVVEHREQASRPHDQSAERRDQAAAELRRLQQDWGGLLLNDPYSHPSLEAGADGTIFRLR